MVKKKYDLFISFAQEDRAWVEGYLLDALAQYFKQLGGSPITRYSFMPNCTRLLN